MMTPKTRKSRSRIRFEINTLWALYCLSGIMFISFNFRYHLPVAFGLLTAYLWLYLHWNKLDCPDYGTLDKPAET